MTSVALFLMGPTAAGKTAAAIDLVERFPFEIISCDSALVYRGLDIGTAKPGPAECERAPHRLIDIVEPNQSYSAGDFRRDARAAATEIRAAGKVPLLVGGTMLYFRAYASGLAELPAADPELRAQIDEQAAKEGWPALHARLALTDPVAASRIHPNDGQRIQRALEVFHLSGQKISALQAQTAASAIDESHYRIAWCPPRQVLYQNCEKRLNHMIDNGFLDELRDLYQRGDLNPDLPAMRAVGYRQFWPWLAGKTSLEEATGQALVATRRLVKRQLTWLRAEPGVVWLDPGSEKSRNYLYQLALRVVQRAEA